ncbi:hypothetical protein EU519_01460 [Candidatus Thorarchaeota archaeon]|nr:MAG: hypothetical protein EU519_01460 [Candidatus Thorarchaeota archaeon]
MNLTCCDCPDESCGLFEETNPLPKRARCPYCDRLFSRDRLDDHVRYCRMKDTEARTTRTPSARTLIVDGNNVAYYLSRRGVPRVSNLILARQSLRQVGYRPIIVVSAALIHKIDRPEVLGNMIDGVSVIEAPRGRNDDLTIIRLAQKRNAEILSNDRFLDWQDRFPWLASRLRRYRMTPAGLILS